MKFVYNARSLCVFTLLAAMVSGQGQQTRHVDDGTEVIIKNAGAADFHSTPIMPPCFTGAMQRINHETGSAVFLIRAEATGGCVVPSHWHTSGEQITVVSGVVNIRMTDGKSFELKEGGYAYIPAKHVHRFGCAGPCIHFVQSDGPYDIHYVKDDGGEVPLAEALKLDK